MALGLHVAVTMLLTSIIGVLAFMGAAPLESYGNPDVVDHEPTFC